LIYYLYHFNSALVYDDDDDDDDDDDNYNYDGDDDTANNGIIFFNHFIGIMTPR